MGGVRINKNKNKTNSRKRRGEKTITGEHLLNV
jgi:hypothetical protein